MNNRFFLIKFHYKSEHELLEVQFNPLNNFFTWIKSWRQIENRLFNQLHHRDFFLKNDFYSWFWLEDFIFNQSLSHRGYPIHSTFVNFIYLFFYEKLIWNLITSPSDIFIVFRMIRNEHPLCLKIGRCGGEARDPRLRIFAFLTFNSS